MMDLGHKNAQVQEVDDLKKKKKIPDGLEL